MGNRLTVIDDGDGDDDEIRISFNHPEVPHHLSYAVGSLMEHLYDLEDNSVDYENHEMPVIRKKPDLRTFRHTEMYKEVKALCGLPATSGTPNEAWSLERGLQKRENGIASRNDRGSFSANQHRSIANMFIPNRKESRLMSLESKVFISKFNKTGTHLITGCQDSMIRVFDASKGTYHLINRIKGKDIYYGILDLDFSPCGRYFAYSTWSEYFFVLPIDGSDEDIQWLDLSVNHNRVGVFSLRFSPCGTKIIGGCNDSGLYICDRETRNVQRIRTNRLTSMDVNAVSYTSDQDTNLMLCGSDDGILKMYDARCNYGRRFSAPVSAFSGHFDGITYIDPRNDGYYVLTNSKDQSIKVWDLRRPTPNSKVRANANARLLNWDYRNESVPHDYYNPSETLDGDVSVMTYRGHRVTNTLLRAKFSPLQQTGQRYIYTGCGTGRIIIYDVLTGQIKEAIEGHKHLVRDLDWHPVRSEIVSGSWDTHVNLNTYKRNSLHKRPGDSQTAGGPLRRSRRIAHRKGDLDDPTDPMDEPLQRWWP